MGPPAAAERRGNRSYFWSPVLLFSAPTRSRAEIGSRESGFNKPGGRSILLAPRRPGRFLGQIYAGGLRKARGDIGKGQDLTWQSCRKIHGQIPSGSSQEIKRRINPHPHGRGHGGSCPLVNHRYLQLLILPNTTDRLKVSSSPRTGRDTGDQTHIPASGLKRGVLSVFPLATRAKYFPSVNNRGCLE